MSVLASLSALQMYHRSTREPVAGPAVVRFLLTDRAFPRSVAACLARVAAGLGALPRGEEVLPAVRAAEVELGLVDPTETDGKTLDDAMDGLQLSLAAVHDQLAVTYLVARRAELDMPLDGHAAGLGPVRLPDRRPPASTRRSTRPASSARSGGASSPRWPAWVGPRWSSAAGRPTG